MRSDLPVGFLAAQVTHAAGESVDGPVPPETNAVVLAVHDEASLVDLAARLCAAQIPHALIREPDPPWCGAATAIGLRPIADRTTVRPILSSLPLLGKEVKRAA